MLCTAAVLLLLGFHSAWEDDSSVECKAVHTSDTQWDILLQCILHYGMAANGVLLLMLLLIAVQEFACLFATAFPMPRKKEKKRMHCNWIELIESLSSISGRRLTSQTCGIKHKYLSNSLVLTQIIVASLRILSCVKTTFLCFRIRCRKSTIFLDIKSTRNCRATIKLTGLKKALEYSWRLMKPRFESISKT